MAIASTRGTTSRWIGEMPSTSIAAISSRMVRAPRSAQTALPPAPAISSAVTIGAACCTIARTLPAPVWLCAPNWRVSSPSSSAIVAPNGIVNSAVGSAETFVTNQVCSMYSRSWNGRLKACGRSRRPGGTGADRGQRPGEWWGDSSVPSARQFAGPATTGAGLLALRPRGELRSARRRHGAGRTCGGSPPRRLHFLAARRIASCAAGGSVCIIS